MDKDASGRAMSGVAQEPSGAGRCGGARQAGSAGAAVHAGGIAGNARNAPFRPPASSAPCAAGGEEGGAGRPEGVVRRSGDGWEATDLAQNEMAARLARYEPKARESYLEALYALQQDEYPGRLVHAAHSLRDVIDLLARSKQAKHERKKSLGFELRKTLLQEVFDPRARHAARGDSEYEELALMYSKLSEIAHHERSATEEELTGALSRLEEALEILDVPQLAINKEMDDILSKPPSEELARRLVGMQNRVATQNRLADNLPTEWLPHMRKAGYFSEPQPAGASDHLSYPIWPPSQYLRKCTRQFGPEVAEIIMTVDFKHESERNPAVYMDFLACACDLPLSDAERIAAKALKEDWCCLTSIIMHDKGYLELARRLYLGGKHDTAVEMLSSLLRAKMLEASVEYERKPDPQRFTVQADAEWLAGELHEKMRPLAKSCPWPVMDLLGRFLDEVVNLGAQRKKQVDKADVQEGERVDKAEAEDAAVSALLDCKPDWSNAAWSLFQRHMVAFATNFVVECIRDHVPRTPDGVSRLREIMEASYKKGHVAFRRIELSAYAEFPAEFKREIGTAVLMYFDRQWTHDEQVSDDECRTLLRSSFRHLGRQAKQEVLKKIDRGLSQDRLDVIAAWRGEAGAQAAEKRWRLKHLHQIREHLEGDHLAVYQTLLGEMGEPMQVRSTVKVQDTWHGGGSALAGKSADQAFEYMMKCGNSVDRFFERRHLGTEFEEYARDNPKECSKRACEARAINPAALRYMVSGLDAALREGKNIDWDGVLQLIEHAVAAKHPHGHGPAELALLSAMCGLIGKGLECDFINAGMRERVWGTIEVFVEIGAERVEDADTRRQRRRGVVVVRARADRRAAEPAKMSPLDESLNGMSGLSFHAVCRYAAWCGRQGEEEGALAPEARRVFDSYLDKGMGAHSAARHAVLGFFLSDLYRLDREWAGALPSRIASGREAKGAFWESYVVWNDVYPHAFKDLLPLYREFSKKGAMEGGANKRVSKFTVIHVMLAHLYGLEGADTPTKNLLNGSDDTLQECARQLSIIMRGKADDPDFNKERLAALWRHPGLAKCDLGMWLVNSPLDRRDTIALYRDHVAGYQGKINLYTPVKHLAPYAQDFPEEVADCLDMLVGRCDGYVPDHVRDVLAILRGSDSPAVKEKCRAIDEKLAQRGREWGS